MMLRQPITFLVTLCLVAIASTASAAPKIALPAIEGDTTGAMRDDVAAALDGVQFTVLGEKEVNRAVDRLHNENIAELSEKQAQKLSKDLEVDAILTAVLGRKGKKRTLKFRVFVNGKKLRGFTVQFKSAKSPRFKTALRDKIAEKLEPAPARVEVKDVVRDLPKQRDDDDEDEDEPIRKGKVVKREVDDDDPDPKLRGKSQRNGSKAGKRRSKKTAARRDDEDDDEGDDDGDDDIAISKRAAPKHSANRAAARIDAGMSYGNRSLIFTQRANFPEGPKAFRSSPVPGARFELELFPYAFVNPNSVAAGLGAAVEYDKTLVLNLGTSAEPGKKVPVDQQHYSFGARFRYAFGKRPTSPTVTAGVDYGRRRWKADRSKLVDAGSLDLPDTDYKFIAPGLGFRIPFGTLIAFVAYGEAMIVNDAGPIQKSDSYGKAKIFGFSAEAGFDVVLFERFALRLSGEFTQLGYTFIGMGGALANNRDLDPTTKDVGGAQDRSIGGMVTLGVLY